MKVRRLLLFFLTILIGVGAGLAFGWLFMPPRPPENAALPMLRQDYQTDIVLMAAEGYQRDQDPLRALAVLGRLDADPLSLLARSIGHAQTLGYAEEDLRLMMMLAESIDSKALEAWNAQGGSGGN